ncbi:unnamed protein product [Ixodes persulcatus]
MICLNSQPLFQTCPAVYFIAVCPKTSTERCSVLFVNQAYETEGPLEAVALCFCLAWVFDLQYFVKYRRTFVCFERLVGLKHSMLGCMGTRLLTSLNLKTKTKKNFLPQMLLKESFSVLV